MPEKIQIKPIRRILKKNLLIYSMSVITDRMMPALSDGLKPVQRRIVYAMYKMNLTKFTKVTKVSGDIMGNYHPHGNSSIEDALVRLGQSFNMNVQLVTPQGKLLLI